MPSYPPTGLEELSPVLAKLCTYEKARDDVLNPKFAKNKQIRSKPVLAVAAKDLRGQFNKPQAVPTPTPMQIKDLYDAIMCDPRMPQRRHMTDFSNRFPQMYVETVKGQPVYKIRVVDRDNKPVEFGHFFRMISTQLLPLLSVGAFMPTHEKFKSAYAPDSPKVFTNKIDLSLANVPDRATMIEGLVAQLSSNKGRSSEGAMRARAEKWVNTICDFIEKQNMEAARFFTQLNYVQAATYAAKKAIPTDDASPMGKLASVELREDEGYNECETFWDYLNDGKPKMDYRFPDDQAGKNGAAKIRGRFFHTDKDSKHADLLGLSITNLRKNLYKKLPKDTEVDMSKIPKFIRDVAKEQKAESALNALEYRLDFFPAVSELAGEITTGATIRAKDRRLSLEQQYEAGKNLTELGVLGSIMFVADFKLGPDTIDHSYFKLEVRSFSFCNTMKQLCNKDSWPSGSTDAGAEYDVDDPDMDGLIPAEDIASAMGITLPPESAGGDDEETLDNNKPPSNSGDSPPPAKAPKTTVHQLSVDDSDDE